VRVTFGWLTNVRVINYSDVKYDCFRAWQRLP